MCPIGYRTRRVQRTNVSTTHAHGDVAVAELLVAHGGDAAIGDALHGAVRYSRLAMAAWLLEHGADLERPNFQGLTALEAARERGDAAMVALLEHHAAGGN